MADEENAINTRKWWSRFLKARGEGEAAWEQLPPEARDALDAYLAHREKRNLAIAGITLPLIVAVIVFAFNSIRSNAIIEAKTTAIRETERQLSGNALLARLAAIREGVDKERDFVRQINQEAISEATRGKDIASLAARAAQKTLGMAEKNSAEVSLLIKNFDNQVSTLKAKIKNIEPSAPKGNIEAAGPSGPTVNLIPTGAVLAFDLAGGCPPGWKNFETGFGRMIVGVGSNPELSPRLYRAQGGEEAHRLTIGEMATHAHGPGEGYRHIVETKVAGSTLARGGASDTKWGNPSITASVGSGQPFNTMPPFIALYYCKKS